MVLVFGLVANRGTWAQAADRSMAEALACEAQLSEAQRSRFQLAVQTCNSPPLRRVATPQAHADALVATAPIPRGAAEPSLAESAHLMLYDQPGVVSSRTEAPVASRATPANRGAPKPLKASPAQPKAQGKQSNAQQLKGLASPVALRRALDLAPEVDAVARRYDIDPLLLHAIAHVESRHDAGARSPAGAIGVMQMMPATARRFGVKQAHALNDARTNLEVSASYLKTLQARFSGDLTLVLAAYNAGEGAVERHGRRVPPFPETQSYVRQVLDHYRLLGEVAGWAIGPTAD